MVRMETDAAAVAQALAGDQEAFGVLVERHSPALFRLAFRMTSNEHDAEEVVQETFLRAYRRLEGFQARANFGTWLYRIAINCAHDLRRSRQRHEEHRAQPAAGDPECGDPLEGLPGEGPAPDRLVFGREVQARVSEAMQSLGKVERAAFVLRHFEGYSIEEICRTLGLGESAAKNGIFRAVHKLRQALEPVVSTRR